MLWSARKRQKRGLCNIVNVRIMVNVRQSAHPSWGTLKGEVG